MLTRQINPAANAAGDVMGDLLCEGRGVGAVIETSYSERRLRSFPPSPSWSGAQVLHPRRNAKRGKEKRSLSLARELTPGNEVRRRMIEPRQVECAKNLFSALRGKKPHVPPPIRTANCPSRHLSTVNRANWFRPSVLRWTGTPHARLLTKRIQGRIHP